MLKIVETLLGGPIKKPKRNRGIYSIFPRTMTQPRERSTTTFDSEQKGGEPPEAQLNPHLDMQPFEMGGATYFSKIGPRSGGFTVCERPPRVKPKPRVKPRQLLYCLHIRSASEICTSAFCRAGLAP